MCLGYDWSGCDCNDRNGTDERWGNRSVINSDLWLIENKYRNSKLHEGCTQEFLLGQASIQTERKNQNSKIKINLRAKKNWLSHDNQSFLTLII